MSGSLVIEDIRSFTNSNTIINPTATINLCRAIANDYVTHRLSSGNAYLTNPDCVESYVATILEDITDTTQLDVDIVNTLITTGTDFFNKFTAKLDNIRREDRLVGIYKTDYITTRLALVV